MPGSDPIPPYLPVAKCDHLCYTDGMYSMIQFYPVMKQVCAQCPVNSISTDGGFLIDAKMDDQEYL